MINILFSNSSKYPVSEKKLINGLSKFFVGQDLDYDAEVSFAVIPHEEIKRLAVKYMDETPDEAEHHPVLSFCENELEDNFASPDNTKKYLGEIVVSYEHAAEESKENSKSIDEIILHWAEHGALHLLGIHHD
jgi:rRNA maturation RNase YbeY